MSSQDPHPASHAPGAPRWRTPEEEQAITEALALAQHAHETGRLITPKEAMALAGREARSKETLFSIARAIGWNADVDVDEILDVLVAKFPEFK